MRLSSVAYAGPKRAVAGWELCPTNINLLGPCAGWSTGTRDGWASSRVTDSPRQWGFTGAVASDGSVALWLGPRKLLRLNRDGNLRPVEVRRVPRPAHRRAAIFGSSWSAAGMETDLWAYGPGAGVAYPVPPSERITMRFSAGWARDGRLWVQGWDQRNAVRVAWSDDGGKTWTERLVAADGYPGGLAIGPAGQVAAFAWNDPHATNTLTGGSIVTYDNGKTWQRFSVGKGPDWVSSEGIVGGPGGVATLTDGTIFLVDQHSHVLWRSAGSWQRFRRVHGVRRVDWVQTNGNLVWASHGRKQIYVSSDEGEVWRLITPG